jgi:DNA repair exonuclease SbcCD ATPase subunit
LKAASAQQRTKPPVAIQLATVARFDKMAKPPRLQNNNDIQEHLKAYNDMSRKMTANTEVRTSVTPIKALQQAAMTEVPIPNEVLRKIEHELYDAMAKIAREKSTKSTTRAASAAEPDEIQELYAKAIHESHPGVRKEDDKLDGDGQRQHDPTLCGMIDSLNVWLMRSYTYVRMTNNSLVNRRTRLQAELKDTQTSLQKEKELITELFQKLEQVNKETDQIRTKLDEGIAEIEQAKAINKEYERLKAQNVRLHRAETEVGSLKKQLRDASVKALHRRNQELQTQLLEATAALNKLKDQPVDQPDTPGDSADLDSAAIAPRKSFPEAALVLLRKLKGSLDRLSAQVDNMKDTRGGTGWSIVERTAGMVAETKHTLTKEINDCLALRGKGNVGHKKTEMSRA